MGLGLGLGSGLGLEVGLGVRVRGQGWDRAGRQRVVACDEYICLYLYACDESASKDWPRESVRGMQSMAKAVAWLGLGLVLGLGLSWS